MENTISPRANLLLHVAVGAVGLGCVALGLLTLGPAIKADRAYELVAAQPKSSRLTQPVDLATLLEGRARFDSEAALKRAILLSQPVLSGEVNGDEQAVAEQANILALTLSPLEPRAWAMYGLTSAVQGKTDKAVAALGASYLSSNVLPTYAPIRVWTGILVWPQLSEDVKERVLGDVRRLWSRKDSRSEILWLMQVDGADDVLQIAFAGDPSAIRELNRARTKRNVEKSR